MSTPSLSVVICTHNPRPHYISRVLDALRAQTLPLDAWELLLIDNASAEPLAGLYDISWQPSGRHVHESELGLTPARLRGIAESRGEVIVFVDDDNVLEPNYLAEAVRIGEEYTWLGAWGGTIRPVFEQEPPGWTKPYWWMLALKEVDRAVWSNDPECGASKPCGAGLCIRTMIAEHYANELKGDELRRSLDRRGASLLSSGDIDLVLTSRQFGMGWGNSPEMVMSHLIPRERVTKTYMLRLAESMSASSTALRIHNGAQAPPVYGTLRNWIRFMYHLMRFGTHEAEIYLAQQRGTRLGINLAQGMRHSSQSRPQR